MFSKMQSTMAAGLVLLVPVVVTLYTVILAFKILDGWTEWVGITTPGVGIVLLILSIFGAGLFAKNFIVSRLVHFGGGVLHRIPAVGWVYSTVKEACEALFSADGKKLGEPVYVRIPNGWVLGFRTGESPRSLPENSDVPNPMGAEFETVLVMWAFSAGSGVTVEVNKRDIVSANMSTDQALKHTLTAGVVGNSK